MKRIILINYGAGNMASIRNALSYLSFKYEEITSGPLPTNLDDYIFILPGVGSFNEASKCIFNQQLSFLIGSKPRIIGICLGMQLLFDQSTEGGFSPGLGLINGVVNSISSHHLYHPNIILPHVGWQPLEIASSNDPLYKLYSSRDFYFIHSFMATPVNKEDILATVKYHDVYIPAIVRSNNVIGFQFHPEKSGPLGLHLLRSTINQLSL